MESASLKRRLAATLYSLLRFFGILSDAQLELPVQKPREARFTV